MAIAVLVVDQGVERAVYLAMAATALGAYSLEVAGTVVLVIVAALPVVPDLAGPLPEQETAEVVVLAVALEIPTLVAGRAIRESSLAAVVRCATTADVATELIDKHASIAALGMIANPIAVVEDNISTCSVACSAICMVQDAAEITSQVATQVATRDAKVVAGAIQRVANRLLQAASTREATPACQLGTRLTTAITPIGIHNRTQTQISRPNQATFKSLAMERLVIPMATNNSPLEGVGRGDNLPAINLGMSRQNLGHEVR